MNNPLGVSPSKGNQGTTRGKKKSFDLGGNRTHDLRIRSTVTLPTVLRGRTEKSSPTLYVPLISSVVLHVTRHYNIASRAALSKSVYVSVLKIPMVLADGVSKWLRQNFFFFSPAGPLSALGKILEEFRRPEGLPSGAP